jgi:hypothetical protein
VFEMAMVSCLSVGISMCLFLFIYFYHTWCLVRRWRAFFYFFFLSHLVFGTAMASFFLGAGISIDPVIGVVSICMCVCIYIYNMLTYI